MPTLPLFSPVTHRDGWRQVRAPGGYECWHFSAISSDEQVWRVTIGLWLGYPGDRAYVRKYRQYCRRPTQVTPPTPAEFPSLVVHLTRGASLDKMLHIVRPFAPGDFAGAPDRADVTLGENHVKEEATNSFDLHVRLLRRGFEADLTFRGEPGDDGVLEETQHAVVVADKCTVTGEFAFDDGAIPFTGSGTHRHLFGTRWVDPKVFSVLR